MLKIGDTREVKFTVTEDTTAAVFASGAERVLATPYLVAKFEDASFSLLQDSLPEGKGSVGMNVNIEHLAPSPVGMECRAVAEVINISENGKFVEFKVEAYDSKGIIGRGTHTRAVIDRERFMIKANAKMD